MTGINGIMEALCKRQDTSASPMCDARKPPAFQACAYAEFTFHHWACTQQDVELDKMFMNVAMCNCRIMGPDHVQNVAELACRTAFAYGGVRTSRCLWISRAASQ